jgi:hypothetical protein
MSSTAPATTAPGLYAYEVTAKVAFRIETEPGSPATFATEAEDLAALEAVFQEFLGTSVLAILTDGYEVAEVKASRAQVVEGEVAE